MGFNLVFKGLNWCGERRRSGEIHFEDLRREGMNNICINV